MLASCGARWVVQLTRPLCPNVQIPRLRVTLVLGGDAVRGEQESGARGGDGEEDAVAAAERFVSYVRLLRGRVGEIGLHVEGMVMTYVRKDIVALVWWLG